MVLKKGSTHRHKIIKFHIHYSIDNKPFKKIPAGEVLYAYDQTSKLLVPNQNEIEVELLPEIKEIIPNARIRGDFTVKIKLAEIIPQLLSNFPTKFLSQDIENPEQFYKLDKSLDDPFVRVTESLIKLLGLHAMVAEAEQKGISIPSINLLRLESDKFRYTIFVNSITWEAEKWFKESINHENNLGTQEFNLFLEELNNDFIQYKNDHNLSQMSSSTINSWLLDYFIRVENGQASCPYYLIAKKAFFIKAVGKYFSDIEILENFVKREAKIGGNQFIEYLKSQSHPGTRVEGLVVVNNLEDNVHAEIRIFWYILTGGAKIPYIATSMLCCAHCNLALSNHNIPISGKHGTVYANWVLSIALEYDDKFLKKFMGESLYAKYKALKKQKFKFEKQDYTKADIAVMLIQKISDISSEKVIRQTLGITYPSIRNTGSNYADDLNGEDRSSAHIPNREQAIEDAHINSQMALLYTPRIIVPINPSHAETTLQDSETSQVGGTTVLLCIDATMDSKHVELQNKAFLDFANNLHTTGQKFVLSHQKLLTAEESSSTSNHLDVSSIASAVQQGIESGATIRYFFKIFGVDLPNIDLSKTAWTSIHFLVGSIKINSDLSLLPGQMLESASYYARMTIHEKLALQSNEEQLTDLVSFAKICGVDMLVGGALALVSGAPIYGVTSGASTCLDRSHFLQEESMAETTVRYTADSAAGTLAMLALYQQNPLLCALGTMNTVVMTDLTTKVIFSTINLVLSGLNNEFANSEEI